MKVRRRRMRQVIVGLVFCFGTAMGEVCAAPSSFMAEPSPLAAADTTLHFPVPKPDYGGELPPAKDIYFKAPAKEEVRFNAKDNTYTVTTSMGGMVLSSRDMDRAEFMQYDMERSMREYWKTKAAYTPSASSGLGGLIPGLNIDMGFLDNVFGKDFIKFDLNGSVELIFAFVGTRRDDPALDVRHRKNFNFDFDAKIDINLNAKIGDRINFDINYNTEALFNFDNKLKLQYEGKEDDIIKSIEAGNISFPLNTTLISGVQELFGVKARLQFGNTYVTGVFSEQRSESKSIQVEGGAQTSKFEFKADEYDENKHYFLGQYFRDHYHEALAELPLVNSRIKITKLEVWVTNVGSPVENNRNIVAFTDLGETEPMASNVWPMSPVPYPSNYTNNLLTGVVSPANLRNINSVSQYLNGIGYTGGREFEKVESARRLAATEYTFNPQLGFISLSQPLGSDQVLAVAYQYQIVGDTTVYQVGELSDQGINDPQVLVVKLLKATTLNTESPLWDLMMKNVYALKSYQISPENFRFNIMYTGEGQSVPAGYFTEGPLSGIPLIQVFGMDNLDYQMNRNPDGVFDFLDNAATGAGYIQSNKGLIYFPYVEPFGADLAAIFGGDSAMAKKYAYNELYRYTKTEAQQYPDKNKYYMGGTYKSAQGSEISLGVYNLPQGSVKVTAGNTVLQEGSDYTVNYTAGIVQIINEGVLNSGVPINISTESNTAGGMLTKRMLGLRVEHFFNKDFYVGATLLNLHQSPLTYKVNYGEEPISNTLYGFDFSYSNESRWLTKAVDAMLPFQSSKMPASLNLYGEFAHFIPGHSKAITKEGITYIDDFEGAKSTINLKEAYSWQLASTPQKQQDLFPESADYLAESRASGFNRAKLAWYTVDPIFYGNNRPRNITKDDISLPYVRRIRVTEVFPNREQATNQADYLSVLNLAYYPSEKGPYNFDVDAVPGISAGMTAEGLLRDPASRWGGIMRKIDNTNFEASNVEYIEFWVMDPFIGMDGLEGRPKHAGGSLFFNLGDISEDILRDGRKSFENGMPISATVVDVDTTQWGRVPKIQSLVQTFDNDPATRPFQDIGLNGLNDEDERSFYRDYLTAVAALLGTTNSAYQRLYDDPAQDDYVYFRSSSRWDTVAFSPTKIEDRYKYFNNPAGNSPSSANNPEDYPTQQTNYPNTEDINADNTLSEAENYFQYEVPLHPDEMQVGRNYIVDIQRSHVTLANNEETDVNWYHFKIPIQTPTRTVGQIQNFQSIRFIRMFLAKFSQPVVLRFAALDLVKSDWRKYDQPLLENDMHVSAGTANTEFDISVVNIEENGNRTPVRYVLPPGIERVTDPADQNNRRMNEQALSMTVLNLADGDARGIYKTTNYDFRQFKKVEMYVHLEKVNEYDREVDGDVRLFVRVGSDFQDNYYEYEIPLSYTGWYESARELVWPDANKVEIDLSALVSVKEHRDAAIRDGVPGILQTVPYAEVVGKGRYTVKGTPAINSVKSILIGVRNPQKQYIGDNDDGMPRSVNVWVNELSLNEFSKKSGVAATARAQANLGDLGNISVGGSYSTANFGSIEQKISELPQENIGSYDISVNLELGKFVPEKAGLKLPVHYDLSSIISNPEYNPLDPDVKTKHVLANYSAADKKAFKHQVQDYTLRQNINFMNVRKERTNSDKAPMFWDIENFNISYAYSSTLRRNEDMEYDNQFIHKGSIGYNYSTSSKFFEPFAKTKLAQKKGLALLTDFNFNYVPNQFSFGMDLQRDFTATKLRNKTPEWDILLNPTYYKQFNWNRYYTFGYDITKSISLKYSANANAFLEEPLGLIDTRDKKDSIWRSFLTGGKLRNFDQAVNITYKLPINKIPFLDWINANFGYATTYRWEAGALAIQDRLGNTIANNMNLNATGNVNFVGLYNKVPFLKKINQPSRNRSRRTTRSNSAMGSGDDNRVKVDKATVWETTYKGALRFLMMVRDASVTWSRNEGTTIPGFMLEPDIFGVNLKHQAPGAAFALFGAQGDILEKAAAQGWLSTDSLLTSPYYNQFTQTFSGQATIEPFPDFRISLTMGYSRSENNSGYYTYDAVSGAFRNTNPLQNGNMNVTTVLIKTAFKRTDDQHNNETYDRFLEYRRIMAGRLADGNPNAAGRPDVWDSVAGAYYPYGYKSNSQDVMLTALLAAYTGADPYKMSLSTLSRFPLPNWSLSYSGLTKIKAMRKIFKNFTLSHAYTSSYSVGSYTNNVLYDLSMDHPSRLDDNMNFISQYVFDGVVLSEQFAPLIKVAFTLKNDLSFNFEYRQSRQIGLSFVNNQITEVSSSAWVAGAGYRIKNVGFKVNSGGSSKRKITSDIVLKADVSVRDTKTVLRRIDQNVSTPSAGSLVTSINIYAEYELTKQLSAKVFYDMTINKPHIANLFYNHTGKGGISIIYKLVN
ncbi:cell surface protein SprA [bacterium]|nr:cell surface protein SprA [bacterium]